MSLAPCVRHACGSPGQTFRQRGQVLILFVMGATVIFVIGAIVVDIGLWVSQRRSAQAAADLAALAAATELPDSGAAALKGETFGSRNGFDDVLVRIPSPHFTNGSCLADVDPCSVEVEIHDKGGSLFTGIFGIFSPDIGATATGVHGASPPGPDVALFASKSDSDCGDGPTVDIEAQHVTVTGSTHTNEIIYIDGPDDDFAGPITYVCANGFTEGSQQHFAYQPPPRIIDTQAAPLNVNWSDVPCTVTVPSGTHIENDSNLWDVPGSQLKSNVICSDGDLALSGDGISGHATFASRNGTVNISSTGSLGNHLQPADSLSGTPLANLLVFSASTSSSAVEMTVTAGRYAGYIHAPKSRVVFNGGQNVDLNGAIIALTVLLTGSNITIEALPGLSGPPGPPEIHLED